MRADRDGSVPRWRARRRPEVTQHRLEAPRSIASSSLRLHCWRLLAFALRTKSGGGKWRRFSDPRPRPPDSCPTSRRGSAAWPVEDGGRSAGDSPGATGAGLCRARPWHQDPRALRWPGRRTGDSGPRQRTASCGGVRTLIVVDTNVIYELTRQTPAPEVVSWLDSVASGEVATTAITAAELLYGAARLPDGRRKTELSAAVNGLLSDDFDGRVLSFDQLALAGRYAEVVSRRERLGQPIGIADGTDRGYLQRRRAQHWRPVTSQPTSRTQESS